jgi:putative photosynthetic complex assembly protein 2
MIEVALSVGFALLLWWAGTALVLYLDGLPKGTFRWSMLGATGLLVLAVYGIIATGSQTTVAGALLSFACGLLVWGWAEMSFLTGLLTGPRKSACAPECSGAAHFVHGIEAILWHELSLVAGAAVLQTLSWGNANQIGTHTFLVLWALRQSAKLNLYLGVANPGEEYLPPHLRYLRSFFRHRPMNLLFPLSVTGATVVAVWLIVDATAAGATPFRMTADILLATLTTLGLIEHWLLVLPIRTSALWSWGMRSRERAPRVPATATSAPPVAALAAPQPLARNAR